MKTTVVPAQVTTVEDKVAGSLSFTQLLLLITPVFLGGGVFVLLPPLFGFSYLKLLIISALAVICMTVAIRVKGKIILQWIVVLARYIARPKFYLFNKNDSYLRPQITSHADRQPIKLVEAPVPVDKVAAPLQLHPSEVVRVEAAMADPNRRFHLKNVKGGLRVVITKVEKESV